MILYSNFLKGMLSLTLAFTFTTFFSIEAGKKDRIHNRAKKKRNCIEAQATPCCIPCKGQWELSILWQDQTVYLHDFSMANLNLQRTGNPPVFSSASVQFQNSNALLLKENAQKIAEKLSKNPQKREEIVNAFNAFNVAEQDYTKALSNPSTGGDPNSPIVKNILKDQWLPAAENLASVLSENCPECEQKNMIDKLLNQYTLLLARMIDLLAPRFTIDPTFEFLTIPVFSEAARVYEQARFLASFQLAPILAKCFCVN